MLRHLFYASSKCIIRQRDWVNLLMASWPDLKQTSFTYQTPSCLKLQVALDSAACSAPWQCHFRRCVQCHSTDISNAKQYTFRSPSFMWFRSIFTENVATYLTYDSHWWMYLNKSHLGPWTVLFSEETILFSLTGCVVSGWGPSAEFTPTPRTSCLHFLLTAVNTTFVPWWRQVWYRRWHVIQGDFPGRHR